MTRTLFALALAAAAVCAPAQAQFTVPPIPTVEGPIAGPGPVYPGLRPLSPGSDPADFGYVSEEYFVSGSANGQPYKTRIMVRRPEPAERFSGIVVAESLHSNGFAVTFEPARKSVLLRGHVQVDIAAQTGNVNSLKAFNAERYASLGIASGAQTSQIMAQVGVLLKSNLSNGPLAPLSARRLVLLGTSQSSGVLRTYQSQQHFQARMPDGSAIFDGYLAVSTLGSAQMMVVDVPTVQMPTQTEVNSGAATGNLYRRADSDEPGNRFRLYETAGMPHANGRDAAQPECALPVSDFPWGAMVAMGLNHLVQWVDHGVVPPRAPSYIEVDNDLGNDGSRLALDANGNAKGGVRNPYVDVPVAQYGVPNSGSGGAAFLCSIAGWRIPYAEETLRELYKNHGSYISKLNRSLMDRVREGWMLPEYAEDVRAEALGIAISSPSGK